eukprot:ANDGO_06967.mRNA.1 hypothetical protein
MALSAAKMLGGQTKPAGPAGQFSIGLFGCMEEGCGRVMAAFCCPCAPSALTMAITEGRLVPDKMDICCAILPNVAYFSRRRIRTVMQIPGDTCEDCLMTIFCFPCVLVQNVTEVERNKERFMIAGAAAAAGREGGSVISKMF